MPVFVVVATREAARIGEQIEAVIDQSARLELTNDSWLIDFDGTTRELSEKLKIRTQSPVGAGIAFPITNFSGRGSANIWEWLKLHMPTRTD